MGAMIPEWMIKHFAIILFGIVGVAGGIVLDARHVTADEAKVNQSAILSAIGSLSDKMEDQQKEAKILRVRDRIDDIDSKNEELQLYVDEAPESPLTKARIQNIRRLENAKEREQVSLRLLSSD